MTNTNEKTNWAGRINNINSEFVDFLESSMKSAAMQVEIIDILVNVLKEHDLFSTVLHREGTNSYRIAIKHDTAHRLSGVEKIRVNFNRFNMSLMLVDASEDMKFGIFRFRTISGKPINCTLTSPVHYTSLDDIALIDELKEVFYETEKRYDSGTKRYEEFSETDIDLNTSTMNDLCQKYTSDCILKGKIDRAGYGMMTANEFYKTVDLKDLKKKAGIGTKTISILKEMAVYFGVEGFELNNKE